MEPEQGNTQAELNKRITELIGESTFDAWVDLENLCAQNGLNPNEYSVYFFGEEPSEEQEENNFSFKDENHNLINPPAEAKKLYPLENMCGDLKNAGFNLASAKSIINTLTVNEGMYYSKEIFSALTNTEIYAKAYAFKILKNKIENNDRLKKRIYESFKQNPDEAFYSILKTLDYISYQDKKQNIRIPLKNIEQINRIPSSYSTAPGQQKKRIHSIPLEEKIKFVENILLGAYSNKVLSNEEKTRAYWLRTNDRIEELAEFVEPHIRLVWTTHDSTGHAYNP